MLSVCERLTERDCVCVATSEAVWDGCGVLELLGVVDAEEDPLEEGDCVTDDEDVDCGEPTWVDDPEAVRVPDGDCVDDGVDVGDPGTHAAMTMLPGVPLAPAAVD